MPASASKHELALAMPPVLRPTSGVRFASCWRSETALATGFSSAKATLVPSTVWPRLGSRALDLTIDELPFEGASSLDSEDPLPAFAPTLPPPVEPILRPSRTAGGSLFPVCGRNMELNTLLCAHAFRWSYVPILGVAVRYSRTGA